MMSRSKLGPALLSACLISACSGSESMDAGADPDAGVASDTGVSQVDSGPAPDAGAADAAADAGLADSGEALDAGEVDAGGFVPPSFGRWEKFEPAGAVCADGSQYKVFINFSSTSDNVVFFFEGGGACWDYASCTGTGVRSAANRNGLADTHATAHANFGGFSVPVDLVYPLLNNDSRVNPMADWNKVFMPYCTGDVFTGDTTVTYDDPNAVEPSVEFHHAGHRNVLQTVDMLSGMFDSIPKMFVSGCSAGGAGAVTNYHYLRSGLNVDRGFLLNDSGPIFPDQAMTSRSLPLHNRVRASWNSDPLLASAPMSQVLMADFGQLGQVLASTYPQDRLAHTHFRLDYNYSLYSYERFYSVEPKSDTIQIYGDGSGLGDLGLVETEWRDRAAVYSLWWDDTELLKAQFDAEANLGYFMPFYRETNNSHCLTIPGFGEFTEEELASVFINDYPTLAWAGTEISTSSGAMNIRDYVEHMLDEAAPLQSVFEAEGEGRYLACTPDVAYYDETMCAAAHP